MDHQTPVDPALATALAQARVLVATAASTANQQGVADGPLAAIDRILAGLPAASAPASSDGRTPPSLSPQELEARLRASEAMLVQREGELEAARAELRSQQEELEDLYTEIQAEQERAVFMAEASALLASSLDTATTLRSVAQLAVPQVADWCIVHVVEDDGTVRQLTMVHADPQKANLLGELQHRFSREFFPILPAAEVIRTGEAQLLQEIPDSLLADAVQDGEHLRLLRALGPTSAMGVPLVARGRTVGAITLARTEAGKHYATRDLLLAEELARRAAVAIDNARLYSAAVEADRRKDEFLAMLSHELRNPLAAISTALHVLRTRSANDQVRTRALSVVARQVEHQTRLVNDLMDVSRLTQGKIELRKEPVDLTLVAARAAETATPLIEQRRHGFSLALASQPLCVEGDAARLEQVVVNLLTNAAKYTERGGRIWLEAARDGDHALLRVRDTGAGIPPAMLARVFDLFVQAERTLDRSQGGLGIGLTLVRSLVEMHGGTVRAFSDGADQGSEFVLRLPLAGSEGPKASPGMTTHGCGPTGACVLLVEDNVDARETLRDLLELWGYGVEVAVDGRRGLEAALALGPDAALVDIGLPGLDGYEVARRIRAAEAADSGNQKPIYLIALTGYGQPEDRRRALEAGFNTHLVKPVNAEELARLLQEVAR